ncbi:MAG: RHS repeat-associated core domain-containing protein, partial [Actinobacteria bacterium]|nr:RHS repeat-associated core domain-containing protein [Actinomycetota bacterium]
VTTTYYIGDIYEITYADGPGGGTTGTRTNYTFGGDHIAVRADGPTDTLTYLFGDHLGSVAVTYDPNNQTLNRQNYYPYGDPRGTPGTLPSDHTYTGQIDDPGDLMYYRARYYQPELGRFTQPDSIIPGPGNGQDYNRYMYVRGNPVNANDPGGRCLIYTESGAALQAYAGPCDDGGSDVDTTALSPSDPADNLAALLFGEVAGFYYGSDDSPPVGSLATAINGIRRRINFALRPSTTSFPTPTNGFLGKLVLGTRATSEWASRVGVGLAGAGGTLTAAFGVKKMTDVGRPSNDPVGFAEGAGQALLGGGTVAALVFSVGPIAVAAPVAAPIAAGVAVGGGAVYVGALVWKNSKKIAGMVDEAWDLVTNYQPTFCPICRMLGD